ncbi:hypothetical protein LNI89_10240 [Tenacibaculum dicentrarchi]|nr:hypothetical protein [Tenacibaculum dicentrarchi]MCD8420861.1 hypothetical protein [Tenacibaculum dicentrarchi]
MKIIYNIIKKTEGNTCYTSIFDEHVIQNLITIYGQEKAVSIIIKGKKYDNKFQFIESYKDLICHFEFHPESGLLMTAYRFNENQISEKNIWIETYLKRNKLNLKNINLFKSKQFEKSKIKMIKPEEYLFNKLR